MAQGSLGKPDTVGAVVAVAGSEELRQPWELKRKMGKASCEGNWR